MAKRKNIVPKAPLARMINDQGAERVSEEAATVFAEILEDIGIEISRRASMISKHAGRKTVQAGDIKLAARD